VIPAPFLRRPRARTVVLLAALAAMAATPVAAAWTSPVDDRFPPLPPPACGALIALEGGGCTHGADPAPPAVDHSAGWRVSPRSSQPVQATTTTTGTPRVPCYGDGTDGPRVQAIYAYPGDRPDRYDTVAPSIGVWAAQMDEVFARSAAQTGGVRHVRFVTDPNCNLVVSKVRLSSAGDDTIATTVAELRAQGFSRSDRKYLVWMDSTVLCGIAGFYADDRPTQDNVNNRGTGLVGRVDSGCWGLADRGQSVEAHELMHVLGSVQLSAPNSTVLGHCTDDADRMCYADGSPATTVRQVCPAANEALFDCGHDDYFSTGPPAGSYLATHWNTASSSFLATSAPAVTVSPPAPNPSPSASASPTPANRPLVVLPPLPLLDLLTGKPVGRFTTLTPARVADTRDGTGGTRGALGPAGELDVVVTGRGGVPNEGVAGVVLNVTATGGSTGGSLTVHPSGGTRPPAPNVVFGRGQTRPNLVVSAVGGDAVTVVNASGTTHVVIDVVGWYDDGRGGATSTLATVAPARILDTRAGIGAPRAAVGAGRTVRLQVTGRGGVPTAGVGGVVVNVTATGPTASSFLTVFPSGRSRPLASSLNFVRGETVPNLVVSAVGAGGAIDIYNLSGSTHVVADVVGWLDDGSGAAGSTYGAVEPATLLDTRNGVGGRQGPLGPATSVDVQATGVGGVPASGVAGVVVNVVALGPTASSFITVHPADRGRPTASNLNFVAGQATANVVLVPVGEDGRISVYNLSGFVHVRIDVVGFLGVPA